jgi:hypothetical protein
MRITAAGLQVGFRARDEEAARIIKPRQPFEIDVGAIHDVVCAGFGYEVIEDANIAHFAVADEDE